MIAPHERLARAFEDVGLIGYGGLCETDQRRERPEAAPHIALTEAYHAGQVRLILALRETLTEPRRQRLCATAEGLK